MKLQSQLNSAYVCRYVCMYVYTHTHIYIHMVPPPHVPTFSGVLHFLSLAYLRGGGTGEHCLVAYLFWCS